MKNGRVGQEGFHQGRHGMAWCHAHYADYVLPISYILIFYFLFVVLGIEPMDPGV